MARKRETTTDDVYRALKSRNRDKNPALPPNELANRMTASRPTISNRLHELEEEGRVKYHEVGQATVWWPADESMRPEDEDTVDADQAKAEERNLWARKLERPAAISLFVLIPSSFIFSVLIMYSLISPAFDAGGFTAVILIIVIIGSIASGVLVPLFWIFDSGLHQGAKDDSEENNGTVGESETDEGADTQEPTTA